MFKSLLRRLRRYFRRRTVFTMGAGKVLVSWGSLNGAPCVVLCHAPVSGTPGANAPEFMDLVRDDGTVIQFSNRESIARFKVMLDRLLDDNPEMPSIEDQSAR